MGKAVHGRLRERVAHNRQGTRVVGVSVGDDDCIEVLAIELAQIGKTTVCLKSDATIDENPCFSNFDEGTGGADTARAAQECQCHLRSHERYYTGAEARPASPQQRLYFLPLPHGQS